MTPIKWGHSKKSGVTFLLISLIKMTVTLLFIVTLLFLSKNIYIQIWSYYGVGKKRDGLQKTF